MMPLDLDGLEQWAIGDRVLRAVLRGADPSHAIQMEWRRGTHPAEAAGPAAARDSLKTVCSRSPRRRWLVRGDAPRLVVRRRHRPRRRSPADRHGLRPLRHPPGLGHVLASSAPGTTSMPGCRSSRCAPPTRTATGAPASWRRAKQGAATLVFGPVDDPLPILRDLVSHPRRRDAGAASAAAQDRSRLGVQGARRHGPRRRGREGVDRPATATGRRRTPTRTTSGSGARACRSTRCSPSRPARARSAATRPHGSVPWPGGCGSRCSTGW